MPSTATKPVMCRCSPWAAKQVTNALPTARGCVTSPELGGHSSTDQRRAQAHPDSWDNPRTPRAWSQMRTHRHQASPYLCGAQSTFPLFFTILEQDLQHWVSLDRAGCTWTVTSLSQALSGSSYSESSNKARLLTEVLDLLSASNLPPFCIL